MYKITTSAVRRESNGQPPQFPARPTIEQRPVKTTGTEPVIHGGESQKKPRSLVSPREKFDTLPQANSPAVSANEQSRPANTPAPIAADSDSYGKDNLRKPPPGSPDQLRRALTKEIDALARYISSLRALPANATLNSLTTDSDAIQKGLIVCARFVPQEKLEKFNIHKNNIKASLQPPVGPVLSHYENKERLLRSAAALQELFEQLMER